MTSFNDHWCQHDHQLTLIIRPDYWRDRDESDCTAENDLPHNPICARLWGSGGFSSFPFSLSGSFFIFLSYFSSQSCLLQVHKLLKLQIKPGQESELCHMIIDCCAQQRTYEKFFGLMGQRFCQVYEAQFSNRCTLYVAELQNCAVPQTHKCTYCIS